jgi:transcriptional regulator with XRE-family HTH domain
MVRGQSFEDFLAEELEGNDELSIQVHDAIDDMRLAVQIAMVRERLALSQQALALKSGLTQPMISHIERGDQQPTWPTIVRLLRGLNAQLVVQPDGAVLLESADGAVLAEKHA